MQDESVKFGQLAEGGGYSVDLISGEIYIFEGFALAQRLDIIQFAALQDKYF